MGKTKRRNIRRKRVTKRRGGVFGVPTPQKDLMEAIDKHDVNKIETWLTKHNDINFIYNSFLKYDYKGFTPLTYAVWLATIWLDKINSLDEEINSSGINRNENIQKLDKVFLIVFHHVKHPIIL